MDGPFPEDQNKSTDPPVTPRGVREFNIRTGTSPAAARATLLQEGLRIPVEYRMKGHVREEEISATLLGVYHLEVDRLTQHLRSCQQCFETAKEPRF